MKSKRPVVRRTRREKGATLVESALVLTTLLAMTTFIMDMGRIMLMEQFATSRAQATVRQAAVNNWTATDVQNYFAYNSTTSPATGQNESGPTSGMMGLLPSQVSYSTVGTAGTPDYRLKVTVSGIQAFTWIPFMAGRYTLPTIVATTPAQSLGATN